ncbi:origin recognition complex subunit 4 [Paramarasmius palmivorus]|uniref:Origin recognition complex subunit 4 n=1 Tax=Paramarasmius palmivorus TaxID=297713 RepID=A0AAW0DEJ2_9AGAR
MPKRKAVEEPEGQSQQKRVTRSTSRQQPARPPTTRKAPATRRTRTAKAKPVEEAVHDSEDELDVLSPRERTPTPPPPPKRRGRSRKVASQGEPTEIPEKTVVTRKRVQERVADEDVDQVEEAVDKPAVKKPIRQYGSKKKVRMAEPTPEPEANDDDAGNNETRCMPEETQSEIVPNRVIPTSPTKAKQVSDVPQFDLPASLLAYKRAILSQLQNPVVSLAPEASDDDEEENTIEAAKEQIKELLHGSVHRSEGNSCMVLGPRGSGKSRIVEQCIEELDQKPIVIRLSGWIQNNDRLAMREIAYQLNEQAATQFHVGDDGQADEDEENPFVDSAPRGEEVGTDFSVPASHIHALITCIPTLSRPTILILEGFDLFALHPRQSLLYSLLDTVQSCRAGAEYNGMAVIGITTRMDTINLFEKRVKSRFSGRMIRTAAPRQTKDWLYLARGMLVPSSDHHPELKDTGDFQKNWECRIDDFLAHERTRRIFDETFSLTKDVRLLSRVLASIIIKLTPASPWPTPAHLEKSVETQRLRAPFPQLRDLSYPSLCLLVASIRADKLGYPAVTFEMLHQFVRDEIRGSNSAPVQLHGRSIGMMRVTRPVLETAFQSMVSAMIFVASAAVSATTAKEFVKYRCAVERLDIAKAIETNGQLPLKNWWKKVKA